MKTVKAGNEVKLHYKGTFEDGEEFDSSYSRGEPMNVVVGSGGLIQGFDDALRGMAIDEKKTFTLTASDAYGERDENAFVRLSKEMFPDDFQLLEGSPVPLQDEEGRSRMATISEVGDDFVTADLNHPMAGKELTFQVEVLEIT